MKILLLSYSSIKFDGRLRELITVCNLLGDCTYITNDFSSDTEKHVVPPTNKRNYKSFVKFCLNFAKQSADFDIIFADNRRALYPAYKIYRKQKKAKFIIDVRELYLMQEVGSFVSKIGCLLEKKINPKADIVIAANQERSKIMQEHYNLAKLPLVFENVRALSFPENYQGLEQAGISEEILQSLAQPKFKLISTSGCSISRTNDVLVRAVSQFQDSVNLYLVGSYGIEDCAAVENLISELSLNNVFIIKENLHEGELKDFIQRCDVGVVNYHMLDLNNTYCASGKIYEFLAENKPVITTENPPLKNMVNKYKIGVADNQYSGAIKKLLDNYDFYQKNVEALDFRAKVSANNEKLVEEIKANL
ncbi:MAG: glycosyltransferase family 4 protein [Clostridiaceae bacterium]|nr:glycosyltransferase family 4 protein [Clostridiaceae bacterium]